MRLVKFEALKVFDHLNFFVEFNKDITFLTGINGSGKTTALRLVLALMTPSFQELDIIPHKKATIHLDLNGKIISISSQNDDESITITTSGIKEELTYDRVDIRQFEGRQNAEERIEEHYAIIEERFSNHPVIQFLTEIDTPTFLGLERRQRVSSHTPTRMFYKYSPTGRRMPRKNRAPFRGTLGASLYEIQLLVQDFYRTLRMRQDRINEKLKEDMLLSAFQYEPLQGQLSFSELDLPKWHDKQQLDRKRKEIEEALVGLGISPNKFQKAISDYFDQFSRLTSMNFDKESSEFIEWLINKPQIDRITRIFTIVDVYNVKIKDLFSPVEKFLSLVNRFFDDSNKVLRIDSVGWLEVKHKGQKSKSIESLSSGERQIVVMLAHLSINEERRRAGIFIVDEPELSLHLKWQEIFVDSIMEASPSTQFVLATHSPSIVVDRRDRFVSIGE